MTPEERLLREIFAKSEQDEMPDNYPATHLDKADYAQFCLHKSLASISRERRNQQWRNNA